MTTASPNTMSDREAHKHRWQIDFALPTKDSLPVHYALWCECGATACGSPSPYEVHNVREAAALSAVKEAKG